MKTAIFLIIMLFSQIIFAGQPSKESFQKAQRLYERITGVPISTHDSRYLQMAQFIEAGDEEKAAAIATNDPYFYQVTVKNFAAVMSNRTESPFVELDDFQATIIGAVRDDLDARTLLTGNYIYKVPAALLEPSTQRKPEDPSRRDNNHYLDVDLSDIPYYAILQKQEPQWPGVQTHAGLMTTRAWAKAHYSAGTNRRAVQYAFQEFLCTPIDSWKVAGLPDIYVGRDVDRSPGKDPKVYQDQCRTCHAGMDAMRDAFSRLDYVNDSLVELPENRPAPKYSRNATTYPEGHITKDDSWLNLIAASQPSLGFKTNQLSGHGLNGFGEMLANSEAFKRCMVQRVFNSVCQRNPQMQDFAAVTVLSNRFSQENFNLKKLFQEVAVLPACLGE